ncbi:MAG: hypothetical protein H6573_10820 [Lewinellaceae bacterium]|nr:hypothetical protein [Lewinellaceae bacterium]
MDENEIHWTFYHTRKWIIHIPMNFDKPSGYDNFVKYAESDRSSFGKIRALKDSLDGIKPDEIVSILNQFVENSKFENCYPNKGYCEALGLKEVFHTPVI